MPRFVLLEHRWNGVHWDLMLETGGSLRTWAIDAPIETGVELPARALPDHRSIYLDYEGPISGDRGTVRRVDSGSYEAIDWREDLVRVRLEGRQLVGVAELRPSGTNPGGGSRWSLRVGNVDCRTLREGSVGR